MNFGDEEWFQQLKENATFPSVFAFYIGSNRTITAIDLGPNEEEVKKIPAIDLLPPSSETKEEFFSLVSVVFCHEPTGYYEEMLRLKRIWMP